MGIKPQAHVTWLLTGYIRSRQVRFWRRTGSFIHVILIVALITIRLGYYRAAGLVYLAEVWIWPTVLISSNAGIRNALIIIYGTLPASAAWLLGYGASLWMSGVSAVTVLVFAVLEMAGVAPRPTFTATPLGIDRGDSHITKRRDDSYYRRPLPGRSATWSPR